MAEPASTSRWDRYWYGEASLVRLGAFRIVLLAAAFWAVWHFRIGVFQHADGIDVARVARSWRPIYALELLRIGPPGPATVRVVWAAMLASLALGIVGLYTRAACAVAALLVFYWIAVHYSFGKPHHDCIQLVFGLLALPLSPAGARLSIDSLRRRLRVARAGGDPTAAPERGAWAALPLRVTQISLVLGYFFAGATKLAVSGPGWMNGYTLQGIMLEYDSPWSQALAGQVWLCQLMQVGLIAIQATFPLVLVSSALRWFYVPGAIAFHLIAMQTMATHPFISLWFTLAAFVALERIPGFLGRNVAAGPPVRRVLLAAALLGFAWVTAWLYFRHMPAAFLLALVPLAATAILGTIPALRLEVAYAADDPAATRAVAWLDALDWSGRLRFVPRSPTAPGAAPLVARTPRGAERVGAAAWRAAALRLPLAPVAFLAPRGIR